MNKRMMIVALFSSMVIGCSEGAKDKGNTVKEQQNDKATRLNHVPGVRNNPYDSSGIRHNLVLEALRTYQRKTGDTTKAGMKDFLITDFQTKVGQMPKIGFEKLEAVFQRVQEVGLEKFLSGIIMSNQVKQYFIRLDEITKTVKSTDHFPSFLTGISELEHEVLKSALSERDRESILTISSIAYHSGLFWKNVYDTNSWIDPSPHPAEKWWQWPIVTNADFLGGLLGFLLGGNRYDIENASDWMSGGAEAVLNGI